MTDNNDDKTLNASVKKTLTLKPSGVNQGTVRQDMGRGRTKAVVVETRKRRPLRPEDDRPAITPIAAAAPAAAPRAAEPAPQPARPAERHRPASPACSTGLSAAPTAGPPVAPCRAQPSVAG
jgi:translation initiation factor IF-2